MSRWVETASRLEPEIQGTVYRLVQEALSNTAKHAENKIR